MAIGQKSKIQQVLLNLMLNARDALARGGVGSEVRTRLTAAEAVSLEVSRRRTRDLRKPINERIFDPFFTTKARGQGTGLGLSICDGNHARTRRRSFTVESRAGPKGTLLPGSPSPSRAGPSQPERASDRGLTLTPSSDERAPATGSADIPPGRLLIIDDEPVVADVLQHPARARSGYELVAGGQPLPPVGSSSRIGRDWDAILLDLMLPDADGLDVLRWLNERGRTGCGGA